MTDKTATRHLRFSLLNLALTMTIVALSIGMFMALRRNFALQATIKDIAVENLRYRNELGIFEVVNLDEIHSIRVPSENDEPRKYRVYLPPGKKYSICYASNQIPDKSIPIDHGQKRELAPGYHLLSVKLSRDTDEKTGRPVPFGSADIEVTTSDSSSRYAQSFHARLWEQKNDWLLNVSGRGSAV